MEVENQYEDNVEYQALWGCLTDKEQKFVDAYLMCSDAVQSAIRAGYSEKSARASGYAILNKEKVQKVIFYKQNGVVQKFKLQTKEDATDFLVELIHTTYTAKKFTTSLQALQLLGEWNGFNAPVKSELLKKDIKINFFDNNSKKRNSPMNLPNNISDSTKYLDNNSQVFDVNFSPETDLEPLAKEQSEDTDI